MRLLPYGDRAVLVELPDSGAVRAWQAAVALLPGVLDTVPAARTLLVISTPAQLPALRTELAGLEPGSRPAATGPVVEIEVDYDGPDLAEVSRRTGLGADEVVERHRRGAYAVAFTGFAPGFAYLDGLDRALRLPRRDTPRPRVPRGSVAIADTWSAIYPRSSPGGWHLLGRTEAVLFDAGRDPPALLSPGTRVRFVAR